MANEVTVLELRAPRQNTVPARTMPPIDRQVLSIDGAASDAFEEATVLIAVYTSVATNIDIRGTPATGNKFPLPAGVWQDFDVTPGQKIQAFS